MWKVKTVSGHAGGVSRKAGVTLFVECEADTVEEVRAKVASAPELLEQCQKMLEVIQMGMSDKWWCRIADRYVNLEAVIAKAKGE
jgi:adenosine deaminase